MGWRGGGTQGKHHTGPWGWAGVDEGASIPLSHLLPTLLIPPKHVSLTLKVH